jgi:hypothetical protein
MQPVSRQQLGKHIPVQVLASHNNTEAVLFVRSSVQAVVDRIYASSCVVTLSKKLEEPTACEMRSVTPFLNARDMKPADIHQLCEVSGEHAMCDSVVRRWVRY